MPLAIGTNVITGYCGMVSMGQAAFFGIGAYTSALLTMRLGVPWPVAFAVSGVVAGAAGTVLALPCLRVRSDFLSLITIAFNQLFLVVANAWLSVTRGTMGLPQVPRWAGPPAARGRSLPWSPRWRRCVPGAQPGWPPARWGAPGR